MCRWTLVIGILLTLSSLSSALGDEPSIIDWTAFDDPQAFLLTEPLAKWIRELPAPDKAAAMERLQESLKSGEVEIRRRAALTLSDLGDKIGVPTMIADLSAVTGRDRDNVVVALRVLRDERAIPALRKALKDKSPYVRSISAAALGEMKAAESYDDLVALTKDKEAEGAESQGKLNCLRIYPADSACYALGALGDERAIPLLIELLADKDVHNSARQALEALTKQKFGDDTEKWKAWWKDHAPRDKAVSAAGQKKLASAKDGKANDSAESPILSLMMEKADVIAHVKAAFACLVLRLGEERCIESLQVIESFKGPVEPGQEILALSYARRTVDADGKPIADPGMRLPVENGKAYIVFLKKTRGGPKPRYALLDPWVGALPYRDQLAHRLRAELLEKAAATGAEKSPSR